MVQGTVNHTSLGTCYLITNLNDKETAWSLGRNHYSELVLIKRISNCRSAIKVSVQLSKPLIADHPLLRGNGPPDNDLDAMRLDVVIRCSLKITTWRSKRI